MLESKSPASRGTFSRWLNTSKSMYIFSKPTCQDVISNICQLATVSSRLLQKVPVCYASVRVWQHQPQIRSKSGHYGQTILDLHTCTRSTCCMKETTQHVPELPPVRDNFPRSFTTVKVVSRTVRVTRGTDEKIQDTVVLARSL